MSASIEALSSFGKRFTISDPRGGKAKAFRFSPHHLRLQGLINKEFRTEDNPNGYHRALQLIGEMDLPVAARFIWLCLDKKPSEFDEYSKFESFLLDRDTTEEGVELLFKLVAYARETGIPDFTHLDDGKKKVLMGLALVSLAMIGMTHTLIWLYELTYPIVSSYF